MTPKKTAAMKITGRIACGFARGGGGGGGDGGSADGVMSAGGVAAADAAG
jgi:hypothetical protein